MRRRHWLAVAAVVPLALLAGCGEDRPATTYKQGVYQGKKDSEPWNNERFKGNKSGWENAIKERNQAQNEYTRITPQKQGG